MKVAVENSLSPVSDYLSKQGCEVESLDRVQKQNQNQSGYTAVVISGMDQNLMGMQDIQMNCPVINADGLTPQEIYDRIQTAAKVQ